MYHKAGSVKVHMVRVNGFRLLCERIRVINLNFHTQLIGIYRDKSKHNGRYTQNMDSFEFWDLYNSHLRKLIFGKNKHQYKVLNSKSCFKVKKIERDEK